LASRLVEVVGATSLAAGQYVGGAADDVPADSSTTHDVKVLKGQVCAMQSQVQALTGQVQGLTTQVHDFTAANATTASALSDLRGCVRHVNVTQYRDPAGTFGYSWSSPPDAPFLTTALGFTVNPAVEGHFALAVIAPTCVSAFTQYPNGRS
jgi:hypothetical protein